MVFPIIGRFNDYQDEIMTVDKIQQHKQRLQELIIQDAYVRENITLSSGKSSDYYIDARRITLTSEGVFLCAQLILDKIQNMDFDAIGGPTLGADPILGAIGALSYQAQHPLKTFIIRKTLKAYGKQQQIEGPILPSGAKVILIDDIATTGKAFLQSIEVLRQMDISVIKAICIVDRQEGAKEALAAVNCELESLLNISDIHK